MVYSFRCGHSRRDIPTWKPAEIVFFCQTATRRNDFGSRLNDFVSSQSHSSSRQNESSSRLFYFVSRQNDF
ncbi:MAG: hypothetical protein NTY53_23195, partial [Kiritimatiellaeota bacterium]|nr:hypothetical protein [Kiritimatiellota bacterium]